MVVPKVMMKRLKEAPQRAADGRSIIHACFCFCLAHAGPAFENCLAKLQVVSPNQARSRKIGLVMVVVLAFSLR